MRAEFRGLGIGKTLVLRLIDDVREIGYERMRLDTLPTMTEASALYESLRFVPIAPYRYNPVQGTRYLELRIAPGPVKR